MLQVNQVFILEQMARTASMHKRVISAAERYKRVYIEVPSTLAKLSKNISHFFLPHLGRNLAQMLAYVLSFSSKSKQRICLGQATLSA